MKQRHAAYGSGADGAGASELEHGFRASASDHRERVRISQPGPFAKPSSAGASPEWRQALGEPLLTFCGDVFPQLRRAYQTLPGKEPVGHREGEVEPDDHCFTSGPLLAEPVADLLAAPVALQAQYLTVLGLCSPDVPVGVPGPPRPVDRDHSHE